jgi:hypothetical protein
VRRLLSFLALLICAACPAVGAQESGAGRALSMRMLETTLKAGNSQQALTLCGITRFLGFVVDPAGKDIILVGRVDPAYPRLQADDLIVALRYAHRKYARREGDILYYTPPGCSIDPDPEVLQQLRHVGDGRGSSDEDRAAVAAEWEMVGRRPQNVRVLGVPFDTHFAQVMVDADYYMKRLSNGSVDLGIDGFRGVMAMREGRARTELALGLDSAEPEHSLNRFWFCPGEATYEESDGLVMLRECQVKLLTEEEFLTSRGDVEGLGRPSVFAQQFAGSFTEKYSEVAEARPIYKELEALFRFTALAGLMKDKRALSRSGNPLTYLLSQHEVQNVPVSRMVTGQTRVLELQDEKDTYDGTEVRYVTLMSCGGVDMDVRPRKVASRPAAHASAGPRVPLSKTVLARRSSRSALYWDFPLPD